jgi:hypothetical protein
MVDSSFAQSAKWMVFPINLNGFRVVPGPGESYEPFPVNLTSFRSLHWCWAPLQAPENYAGAFRCLLIKDEAFRHTWLHSDHSSTTFVEQ